VLGDVTADDITADSFLNSGVGSPSITSATTFTMTAPDGVIVTGGATGGPFRLPTFTNTQRDALSAVNGDMIYNSTDNRIQAYVNGAWRRIDDSAIV
jgi:predicted TIM-barrel enzyme